MAVEKRWSVEAPWEQGTLRAFEPTLEEVQTAAQSLATFYNDLHNSAMMSNTEDASAADVVARFCEMCAAGERPFLLVQDGELLGDADFRKVTETAAEFAILVGPRGQQSRGLGTRFAAMLHAVGLRAVGFERIYATVIPQNIASRRMLEKIGYEIDLSPQAAIYTDEDTDIAMSIDRARFEQTNADLLRQFRVAERRFDQR
jgi:ribosomal-protein-alanine N-acetyltransferase